MVYRSLDVFFKLGTVSCFSRVKMYGKDVHYLGTGTVDYFILKTNFYRIVECF